MKSRNGKDIKRVMEQAKTLCFCKYIFLWHFYIYTVFIILYLKFVYDVNNYILTSPLSVFIKTSCDSR